MTAPRLRSSEIGPERYCYGCREWWPDDAEFWYVQPLGTSVCRACQRASHRLARRRKAALAKLPQVNVRRVRCAREGCPVEIPDDDREFCHFDRKTAKMGVYRTAEVG